MNRKKCFLEYEERLIKEVKKFLENEEQLFFNREIKNGHLEWHSTFIPVQVFDETEIVRILYYPDNPQVQTAILFEQTHYVGMNSLNEFRFHHGSYKDICTIMQISKKK